MKPARTLNLVIRLNGSLSTSSYVRTRYLIDEELPCSTLNYITDPCPPLGRRKEGLRLLSHGG